MDLNTESTAPAPHSPDTNRRRTAAIALAAVLFLPLLLASSSFVSHYLDGTDTVTPDRSAMIGTWRSTDGATLIFRADGTYTSAAMPQGSDAWTASDTAGLEDGLHLPPDGSGSWQVHADREDDPGGGIELAWDDGAGMMLDTSGDAHRPTLFVYVGGPDEDDEYVFMKQPGNG